MAIRIHILVLVPFIALATIGLLLVLRRRGHPASRVLFIAVFAAYLTGVASFVFFPTPWIPGRRTRSGGLPPDLCDVSAPGPG
jgi:hypothetical protein